MIPEVEEEYEEGQAIQHNNINENGVLIGTILQEKILANVGGDHYKLDLGGGKKKRKMKFSLLLEKENHMWIIPIRTCTNNLSSGSLSIGLFNRKHPSFLTSIIMPYN